MHSHKTLLLVPILHTAVLGTCVVRNCGTDCERIEEVQWQSFLYNGGFVASHRLTRHWIRLCHSLIGIALGHCTTDHDSDAQRQPTIASEQV